MRPRARSPHAKRAAKAPATCTAEAHVRSARSLSYAAEPCCAKETARILREQARADDHRSAQLKNEIKVLCAETDAAKRRIKQLEEALTTIPSAQLRLKVKLLCVKYHPDHGQTTLSSAEVARDLIELLSD